MDYGGYDMGSVHDKWYQSRPILGRASAAIEPLSSGSDSVGETKHFTETYNPEEQRAKMEAALERCCEKIVLMVQEHCRKYEEKLAVIQVSFFEFQKEFGKGDDTENELSDEDGANKTELFDEEDSAKGELLGKEAIIGVGFSIQEAVMLKDQKTFDEMPKTKMELLGEKRNTGSLEEKTASMILLRPQSIENNFSITVSIKALENGLNKFLKEMSVVNLENEGMCLGCLAENESRKRWNAHPALPPPPPEPPPHNSTDDFSRLLVGEEFVLLEDHYLCLKIITYPPNSGR